jgi:hypothetical protein
MEFAQIQQTLALERELAVTSWRTLLATRGNRRRTAIAAFLGLATVSGASCAVHRRADILSVGLSNGVVTGVR